MNDLVGDTVALLDHLGLGSVRVAGHSMGGWVAERLAIDHSDRVRGAVFMGSCNVATSWEKAITTVNATWPGSITTCRRSSSPPDPPVPPQPDLQDDAVVDAWL